VDHFPAARNEYASSIAFAIITRLSIFVLFAYPFDREISELLKSYRHRVELAPKALGALAAATFSAELEKTEDRDDEDDWGFIKPQKTSQQHRKRMKRIAARATILFDPKLFESLGLFTPRSPEEVETVYKLLVDEHKAILKVHSHAPSILYVSYSSIVLP
jgi:hypothetical protein